MVIMRCASAAANCFQARVSNSIAASMPRRSSVARNQQPSCASQFLANISSARRRSSRLIAWKALAELSLILLDSKIERLVTSMPANSVQLFLWIFLGRWRVAPGLFSSRPEGPCGRASSRNAELGQQPLGQHQVYSQEQN